MKEERQVKSREANQKRKRERRKRLRENIYRRRFLIPNLVTVGNLFCGFLALVYASSGRFEKAAIAIGFAILLDGLDGRVARGLNATSRFGVEFDSFSDLVSFGLAPAMMVYQWCFRQQADEFGVSVTFLYVACAASRLARFNITTSNHKGFEGLPSPAAAALLTSLVYFAPYELTSPSAIIPVTLIVLTTAILMVSTIEFLSVKHFKFRSLSPLLRISVAALIGLVWYHGRVGFLTLTLAYVVSGPVLWLRKCKYLNKIENRNSNTVPASRQKENSQAFD
jgi:CDP-diacylglycerol---serine O-phosphatidyltransferase